MNVLGVILSGGKSSRMGTDKGLVEYQGKAMIEYSIELLDPLCDELVISTNSLDYLQYGFQTIPDIIPEIGPIGGLFSVMTMLRAERYFFISCDVPYNPRQLAEALIKLKSNKEIIVPVHSGRKKEPLFGLYSYSVLPRLKKQIDSGNYKLMELLAVCDTLYYEVPDDLLFENPDMFKNINTLNDVE